MLNPPILDISKRNVTTFKRFVYCFFTEWLHTGIEEEKAQTFKFQFILEDTSFVTDQE